MRRKRDDLHYVLDEFLRLSRWPSREAQRIVALTYLATKFDADRRYSEPAVNSLLRRWSAFDDPALLRRELFERGFLDRTRDGRSYWLRPSSPRRATSPLALTKV